MPREKNVSVGTHAAPAITATFIGELSEQLEDMIKITMKKTLFTGI